MSDTIAAIATPPGTGGVGVIRISGPTAGPILCALMGKELTDFPDRKLVYGSVRYKAEIVDDVLGVLMRGPRSFTGEDVAEVHGHGGQVVMAKLLRCILENSARQAEPGEFTRRALENGKLDLLAAESLHEVINAQSEKHLRLARGQLDGALGRAVQKLDSSVVELLAELEARIDFPEEGIEDAVRGGWCSLLEEQISSCEEWLKSFSLSRRLATGVTVVMRGTVNAGKSSLFNALVGVDRAMVSSEPGTTRDYIDSVLELDGVSIRLVDTAGERDNAGELEEQGILRSREQAGRADIVVRVVPATSSDAEETTGEILVRSKSDLSHEKGPGIYTSAKTREGLDDLKRVLHDQALSGESALGEVVVFSERQYERLSEVKSSLELALSRIQNEDPEELAALDLRVAQAKVAEFLGNEVGDEVLDHLFGKFCIGK